MNNRYVKGVYSVVTAIGTDKLRKLVVGVVLVMQLVFFSSATAQGQDCFSFNEIFSKEQNSASKEAYDGDATQLDAYDSGNTQVTSFLTSFAVSGYGAGAGCNYDEVQGKYDSEDIPVGFLGYVDNLNANMLANPAQVNIAMHLKNEWVPGSEVGDQSVYAQDGFEYLRQANIDTLWEQSRIIAYALFVIVLIAAGFMIMFRQKIGGQLAVSIYNTIPRVVAGLVLVTFSFAIAGLLIDFGVVLMVVADSILGLGSETIFVQGPFSLLWIFVHGVDDFASQLAVGGIGSSLGIGLAGWLLGGPAAALGGLFAVLVMLAVFFVVAYASVKVYITLLKAYLGILVDTILGPIVLALAVVPGKSEVGWGWFNRILKNVLSFVLVFFFVNLAMFFIQSDIVLAFPSGLAGGDTAGGVGQAGLIGGVLQFVVPIALLYVAAESPSFLDDFLPSSGGKGSSSAFQNVQKALGDAPIIGGIFK